MLMRRHTQTIEQFVGNIWQAPPAYSALRVNGVRAYKLARYNKCHLMLVMWSLTSTTPQ